MLECSRFLLELLILLRFLFDLLAQLRNHVLDCFDTLLTVELQLRGLRVETLLIVFFFLNVLALDDFLRLFCDAVELHIHRTLGKIDDLELDALVDALHSLEQCGVANDVGHVLDFGVAAIFDLTIPAVNLLLEN